MNRILISSNAYKSEPLDLTLKLFGRISFNEIDLHLGQIYFNNISVKDAKKHLENNEIKVLMLSGGWCDFFTNSLYIEDTFRSIEKQVLISRELECRKIRIYFGRLPLEYYSKELLNRITKNLSKLSDLYQDISFFFENHDGASLDPDKCREILENVNRTNIRMLFDPANFEKAGVNAEHAYKILYPYISHVHLKGLTGGNYCEFGDGDISFNGIIKDLVQNGYKGNFSLEYEGVNDRTVRLLKSYNLLKGVLN